MAETATSFPEYDIGAAIAALDAATSEQIKLLRKYIDGDHWQNGTGWIGPRPQPDESGANEVIALIKQGFQSANKIAEVCERHADGVIGREPRFTLIPRVAMAADEDIDEAVQAQIDEAEAMITRWWNERAIHSGLQEAATQLLWARRQVLRLYVPPAFLNTDGTANFPDVQSALNAVYLDVPKPEDATVIVDPETKDRMGVFRYKNAADKDEIEFSFLAEASGAVDEPRVTVIRILRADGTEDSTEGLLLGNRITMYEMQRASNFITDSIVQNQKALNFALSTVPKTIATAGFIERMLTNAQMPGYWKTDPTTGEKTEFVPGKFKFGASKTNVVVGLEQVDASGNKTYTQPGIHEREPISPAHATEGYDIHYRVILEEAKQKHILIAGDATASGKSRVEARTDFENSLRRTVPTVESAGRWLIETALAIAEMLSGKQGTFTEKYRCDFTCRLAKGAITVEERQQNADDVEAGLLPVEYAMSDAGIDDVDAALALINSQPKAQLAVIKERADVFGVFINAGLGFEVAATLAGLDAEQIALIKKYETENKPEPDPNSPDPNAEITDPAADPADPVA